MTIDISEYKGLYLETARKLIETFAAIISLPDTEQTNADLSRIFHSLKGQSMAMGYKNIATLSLQMELLFKTLIENNKPLTSSLKALLPLPKTFYDKLDYIKKTNGEQSLTKEIEAVEKLVEALKNEHLRILVAEDDIFFQKICIDKLKEKSLLVDFADNGEDAIARMATKKYDCILLDIIMPKKNGFDVLQFARENNIVPHTPIIVFSTIGQEESVKKALTMGAVDFINKGEFDFDLLIPKIMSFVHKK